MNVDIVASYDALPALCERVAKAPRVGLDTEFHAERTYAPRLMVVQLAFEDGAVVVDPIALPDLDPLSLALAETTVVGHALSSDLKIMADRFGRVPTRIFDCQVAAAFLGYGMQVSLADAVRDLCKVRLAKSQTVSDWSSRPFTPKQVEYLVDDVNYLFAMQDALTARLETSGRLEWALAECAQLGEIERYRPDERRGLLRISGSNRMNRRELGVLAQLLVFRDKIARDRDIPPKYVLPDDVMAGLATLRPKQVEDLAQLRRLDTGMRRNLGDGILAAVEHGEAIAEEDLPEKPARPLGNSRETLVALLGVAAGEIAREHELPQSLVVPRAALERVAREIPSDRATFEATLGVEGWRLGLIGEPLWRLLTGDGVARVEGYLDGDPKISFSHDRERQQL